MRNCAFVFMFCFGLAVASALAQSEEQPNFPRFNFNVGGGMGIGRGAVGSFAGNTYFGVAGAGMNYNRMFGFSGEYMYYNLNLRSNVANSQSLPGATGDLNAISLNGIVRSPYHLGRLGMYGIFGVGFYRRSVSTTRQTLQVGSVCQPAWIWWDVYCTGSPASVQNTPVTISSFSKIAGGYNFGGGATYRLNRWHDARMYVEWRYHKAYQSDVQTIVWPVTVGLRW